MTQMKTNLAVAAIAAGMILSTDAGAQDAVGDWKDHTIAPVLNPVFFEDPHIRSEVRPIFMHQTIHENFATGGGDIQLYAVELRWAVSDRLAIIATKDGYVDADLGALGGANGFADLAAGVKYAVIDDRENRLVVTPGFEFELPTGNQEVFQGSGKGEWDFFVSAAKGFDQFNLTGNAGARIPNDMSKNTAQLHYSLQVDKEVNRYFIPFVAANAFTTLNGTSQGGVPGLLNTEGFDLINFGSANAAGRTQASLGFGFRSRLKENIDFGFGWEKAVGAPKSIIDSRFTVDLVFKF